MKICLWSHCAANGAIKTSDSQCCCCNCNRKNPGLFFAEWHLWIWIWVWIFLHGSASRPSHSLTARVCHLNGKFRVAFANKTWPKLGKKWVKISHDRETLKVSASKARKLQRGVAGVWCVVCSFVQFPGSLQFLQLQAGNFHCYDRNENGCNHFWLSLGILY